MTTDSFKIGHLYRKSKSRPKDSLPLFLDVVIKTEKGWDRPPGRGVRWHDEPLLIVEISPVGHQFHPHAIAIRGDQFVVIFRAEVEELT